MIDETAIRQALQELATVLRDEDLESARRIVERVAAEAGVRLEGDRPQTAATPAAASGATSPERDVRRWLRTYAKFFSEWQLEEAKLVAQEPPPDVPARLARAPGLVLSGAEAALSGRHTDAREMLDLLLRGRDDAITPRHLVGASRRAQLYVYLARTCMREGDLERATSCLAAAERLGPDDPVVHAGLGQLHSISGEPNAAAQAFQHALVVGPDCPDGYIGMGMLSEDAERHDEAADWFGRAIDMLDGRVNRAERLLAPVPAGLVVASARRVEESDPSAALERFEAALLALRVDQTSLRARIQQSRAPLLEQEDPSAAAQAYFEAATLVDLDRERRRDLLEHAAALDPAHSEARWELADGLRTDALGVDDRDRERELLEHAAAVWDEGREQSAPEPATSWVYTSRALISDRLARLDSGSASEELWAAAALLEQAILTDADEHYRWLHLSRILRALNLRAGGLEASAAALELEPDDPEVLEERCDALIDAGMPEAAAAIVEPLLEGEPTAWTALSAAWALCESGQLREALELVARALERTDDPDYRVAQPSLLALRARCLRRLGEDDEERATLSELAVVTQGHAEHLSQHVWALYMLSNRERDPALLDQAAELLEGIATDDPFDRVAPVTPALVRLAAGDASGAEGIRRGLGRLRLESELRELSDDVAELRPGAGAEVAPVLDELIAEIDRRAAAARIPSPEEELDEREGEPGARLALGLARARFRRAGGDWPGALELARGLAGDAGDADRRRLLPERVLTEAATAAHDLLRQGEAETPRDLLVAALEAAAEASLPFAAASAEALLAVALLRLGDDRGARTAAERAVRGLTLPGGPDPVELFWRECGPVAIGADELWTLDDLVPTPAITDQPATGRRFYAARYLPSLWAWTAGAEPVHDQRPAVRLGDDLIPEDTGPSWPLFSTLMPALRRRVLDETGITVPGTRFLDGPNLTPAEFEILIAGLAAERAPVPAGATNPIAFVVDRLEVALRRRLEQFVTLDDAMELLAGAPDGGGPLPADRAGKLRVAAIMRALATDRVPLTRLDVVRRAADRSDSAVAAAEAIRFELVAQLPGSNAERLLQLPEGLSERIDEVFDLDAGTLQAAASPPAACRIEQELATWITAAGTGSLALVARDEPERRIVQLLARRRGLDTPVLSREEVAVAGRSAEAGKELHA